MADVLRRSSSQAVRWPALRRLVSAVCILTLLLVGFAHHLMPDHYGVANSATLAQMTGIPSEDGSKGAATVALAADHCSVCAAVTLPAFAAVALPHELAGDDLSLAPDKLRAHAPKRDLPPPKSLT